MLKLLAQLPTAGKRVLMMLPQRDENIVLSTRNIPLAKVQHVASINVIELLKHDYVIMPVKTVRWLELVFGEGLSAEAATAQIFDTATDSTAIVPASSETLTTEPLIAPAQGETLPLVPTPSEDGETQATPSTDSEA